jgi:predicted small integral membrane protein
MNFEWMYWTVPTAIFFSTIVLMIAGMLAWELVSSNRRASRIPQNSDDQGYALFRRFAGYRLYPSGLARTHGFEFVVCDAHFSRLDIYRDALGIKKRLYRY